MRDVVVDSIHEREQSNVKFKKSEKKSITLALLNGKVPKKRQPKSSKGSDLSTDSASDHVQNGEEKKKERRKRGGEKNEQEENEEEK